MTTYNKLAMLLEYKQSKTYENPVARGIFGDEIDEQSSPSNALKPGLDISRMIPSNNNRHEPI